VFRGLRVPVRLRGHRAGGATVLAIADELTRDGLVLRYQVDETDDGLSGAGRAAAGHGP